MVPVLFEKDFFLSNSQVVTIEPRMPQSIYPEHTHDFNEIVIVTHGTGKHIINGRLYDLFPGMMFYVKSSDFHLYDQVEDLNLTNVLFRTPDKFRYISNLIDLLPTKRGEQSHYFLDKKCHDNVHDLILKLNNNEQKLTAHKESLFLQLLILLRENQYLDSGHGSSDQRINQLLRWLQSHFTEQVDWDKLSDKFSLSVRTLHRKMKNEMNITPQRYLIKLRLAEAYFQLHYTNLEITTIALNCGFNDSSYFSTCFKNEFNITPNSLRNNPH